MASFWLSRDTYRGNMDRYKSLLLFILLFLVTNVRSASVSFNYSGMNTPFEFVTRCSTLDGSILLEDTCYIPSVVTLNYDDAETQCANDDSTLLSVTTVEEKGYLTNQNLLDDISWLGLQQIVANDRLEWTDGFSSKLFSDNLTSKVFPSEANCPVLENGFVAERPCLEGHKFICKLRHFLKCYPGWVYEKQSDKCYRIFGTGSDLTVPGLQVTNVDGAKAVCEGYPDGQLVRTFAGAFFASWHPFWYALDDGFDAWVGIFYDAGSPTSFVDGAGMTIPTEIAWLEYYSEPELYDCTYYNKTADFQKTRLYPGTGSDCTSINKPFMCEIGAQAALVPKVEEGVTTVVDGGRTRYQVFQIVEGKIMKDHTSRNITARSKIECALRCVNHHLCESFNFYPIDDQIHVCELNDADDNAFLQDKPVNEGFYFGREVTIVN